MCISFTSASFGYNKLTVDNVAYAEMWGHDFDVSILSSEVYYNITEYNSTKTKGFTYSNGVLTAQQSGLYKVSSQFAFSGQPNTEYHLAFAVDGDRIVSCHTERVIGTGGDVGSASITCICPVEKGNLITAMIENVDNTGNPTIHNVNINMVKIE